MVKLMLFVFFNLLLHLHSQSNHSISKRSLLFPRATVLQFTYGLSAPLILRSRSINFSLCFQVNYDLPYNLTTLLQPKIIQAKNNNDFDLSRESFYKYIISFLKSFGLNGEQCLLRMICEISEFPMNLDHKENLLEKIIHFVFTPSLEFDCNSNATDFVNKLMEAEHFGRSNKLCAKEYSKCFVSLVDLFTSKYIMNNF